MGEEVCRLDIIPPAPEEANGRPLLLWDGGCGFCARVVRWLRKTDTLGVFAITPYQDVPTPPMTPALYDQCGHAIHLIYPDGRIERAGKAALSVLGMLGYKRTALILKFPPFIWFVELGYWIIANNRMHISRALAR